MRERVMGRKAFSLLVISSAAVAWLPTTAPAADAAIAPISRPVERVEAASCLRWVWQQYSWYDDCWAARHPYIVGRAVRFALPRR